MPDDVPGPDVLALAAGVPPPDVDMLVLVVGLVVEVVTAEGAVLFAVGLAFVGGDVSLTVRLAWAAMSWMDVPGT